MKKVTTLLLLAVLLMQTAACGTSEGPVETSSADTTAAADGSTSDEIAPDLPAADYKGHTFTFYMRDVDDFIVDMYVEESDGDLMNDAVYSRNSKIAEKYNVTFALAKGDVYGQDAQKTILAGDDAYDVIIPHARFAFSYGQNGLALDWNTDLPYVDLDNPWWNADARKQFSFNNHLYTMIGDISYQNLGATNAMLFNKALFDTYSLEYPYQMVLDDGWTFDEFTKLARQAEKDLNGDTKISHTDDQIGYATGLWIGPIQVLYTAEQRICEKNESDEMYLTLNSERTVEVFEKYFAFTDSSAGYINLTNDNTSIQQAFTDGRVLFYDMNIKDTMKLRDMDDDFGIIPWPKFDQSVEGYPTNVDAGCNLLVVPITASNQERTSVILEALCYESWKSVLPTYYDVVLQTKFTRDEESQQMLDIIREGRVFDIGYFYSNVEFTYEINSIGRFLAMESDHNFSTFYAKHSARAEAALEKINAAYED